MTRTRLRALVLLLVTCALASLQTACATGLFGTRQPSREDAIRACAEEVPADAVPYADAFSACMEARGWTYAGTSGPRS